MAKSKMDLSSFVGKLLEEQDGDTLREGIRVLSQALMESEVSGLIGAERYERSGERSSYRNGYRLRSWDTRVGTIELAIPKIRTGSYFPSLLEPRRRAERALQAVVQEAYVHGVSTRKVDDLLKALGMDGMSKSEVSRICVELDTEVEAFRTRQITGEHPYVWIDATYHKVRQDGRVQAMATVVAIGVTTEGERQILGVDAGPSEDGPFWTAFLRSLVKRGLRGVKLVISDAHEGIRKALGTVLSGASWQRCRVHFMRNLLATIPHSAREPVAAIVRTVFAQPDLATAMAQLHKVVDGLRPRFPQAAALLDEAAEDILAEPRFPQTRVNLKVVPSPQSWAAVDGILGGKDGVCGYAVEKVNVRGIVQRLVDKGFNVRLPTEKIKPMAVPVGIEPTMMVRGKAVALSIKLGDLAITQDVIWLGARVSVAVGEEAAKHIEEKKAEEKKEETAPPAS